MKKHLYAVLSSSFTDGFYYTVEDWDGLDDGEKWVYLGEVEVPDFDRNEMARRGDLLCDKAAQEEREASAARLAKIEDARAAYRSLPPPVQSDAS